MAASLESRTVKPGTGPVTEPRIVKEEEPPNTDTLLLRIAVALESLAETHREEVRLAKRMMGASCGDSEDDED